MNEAALKKTKRDLLLNSRIGKERKRLSEEYRDGIIRITNEILGKEGQKFIEKYKDSISYYNELFIPGHVEVRIFSEQDTHSYHYYCDFFSNEKIPNIIDGLNNVYYYNKEFNADIITNEKDKEWIKDIRLKLENNANEYENLWKEIESVFKNITEKDLKLFPEAYSLYIKFRNECKDEKTNKE